MFCDYAYFHAVSEVQSEWRSGEFELIIQIDQFITIM